MAKEAPWDDQTEMFVSDLNEKISKKYNINIRSLLISPDKYIGTKGMAGIAKQIRGETDEYFSDLMEGMEEEKQKPEEPGIRLAPGGKQRRGSRQAREEYEQEAHPVESEVVADIQSRDPRMNLDKLKSGRSHDIHH